jgi:hypothetical protein
MLEPRTLAFAVFEIVYLVGFADIADFAVSLVHLALVGFENFAGAALGQAYYRSQNRLTAPVASAVDLAVPAVDLAVDLAVPAVDLAAAGSAIDLDVPVPAFDVDAGLTVDLAVATAGFAIELAVVDHHHSIVAAENSAVKMLLNRLLDHLPEIADLVVLADLALIAAADFYVRKFFHSYLRLDSVAHRSFFAHCSRPG